MPSTHYLGLKNTDTPELAGAEFTEDVEHEGNYALQLQNVPDLASKGPGYWFDGVSDVITLPNAQTYLTTDQWSLISVFSTSNSSGYPCIIGSWGGASGAFIGWSDSGTFQIQDTSNNTDTLAITLSNTTETILGISHESGSNYDIYINGLDKGDITLVGGYQFWQIGEGYRNGSKWLKGQISHILLFNLDLTSDEVKAFSSSTSVPYKYIGASQTVLTSGTLTIGKRYRIVNWITDDDFTNIGGSNVDGTEFTATGTTPTKWLASSTVVQIGCVLNLDPSGIGQNQWLDSSGNNLHGTVSGAIPTNLPTNHVEKYQVFDISSNQTFTLPTGYKVKSAVVEETSGNALTGDLDVGIGALGQEIVNSEAVGASTVVNCTIVNSGALQSTSADTTITISSSDWGSAVLDIFVEMIRMIA